MSKNYLGKGLVTLGLGATMAFSACSNDSSKEVTDTLKTPLPHKYSIDLPSAIIAAEEAQKIIQYLKKRGPVTLDIEGFGEVSFSVARREKTFFVVLPNHRLFGVGMDGMLSGSSFDQSKVKQHMNLIMPVFLDHMNK